MRSLFGRHQRRAKKANASIEHAEAVDSVDALALGSLGNLAELAGQQIENALSRLETANNWSFTLVVGAGIGISAQEGFPRTQSLVLLCATTGLMGHFVVRAMKGYANVIRWYILLGMLSAMLLADSESRARRMPDLRDHINQYVVSWLLPVRRRAVWRKIFGEFSFGYVYAALVLAITWAAIEVDPTPGIWLVCVGLLTLGPIELTLFTVRHPYMRKANGRPFKGSWRWQHDHVPE